MTGNIEIFTSKAQRAVRTAMGIFLPSYMVMMILFTISFIPDALLSVLNLISYITGALLVLSFIFLIRPLTTKKLLPAAGLLILFFISYCITIVINRNMNFMGNVKVMLTTGIQLVLLFYYIAYTDQESAHALMRRVIYSLVAATILIATTNIILFIGWYNDFYIAHRFQGIFINSDFSSISALSLLCTIFLLRFEKRFKVIYISNVILQFINVVICASRTCLIFMSAAIILIVFIYAFERGNTKLKFVMLVSSIIVACVASGFVFMIRHQGFTQTSNEIRLNMICCGFDQFLSAPLFGIGPRNVAPIMTVRYPLVNLEGIIGGGLHNAYLQLLVSNGAIGGLILFSLIIYCAYFACSSWNAHTKYVSAILFGLGIYGLLSQSILFNNFPTSVILWSLLGYNLNLSVKNKIKPKQELKEV